MRGATPPLLQYVFMAWCLTKHRGNFKFHLPSTCKCKFKANNGVVLFLYTTWTFRQFHICHLYNQFFRLETIKWWNAWITCCYFLRVVGCETIDVTGVEGGERWFRTTNWIIFCLLKDAVAVWKDIRLRTRWKRDHAWWVGKDLKGSGRGLFEGTVSEYSWT